MSTKTTTLVLKPLVSLSYLEFLLDLKRDKLQKIADTAGGHYKPYDLHKNGTTKWRHIDNPNYLLKNVQKRILKNILNKGAHYLPSGMTGGISGKSVVENAKIHVKKACIGIIDIKDCFPNTKHLRIYNVWKDYFGCGKKTIGILTQLTTFQDRLPQGAPTSPLLCNLSLIPIFKEIEIYTKKHNLNFSIFVDDIAISGNRKDVTNAIQPIVGVLIKNKYAVRRKKIKIINSGFRQKLTGATVNNKVSIGRNQINLIRNLIVQMAKLKGYVPSDKYNFIYGKIAFAKHLSKTHGNKLENFAVQMLVNPILQVKKENQDDKRSCNKYARDHRFKS